MTKQIQMGSFTPKNGIIVVQTKPPTPPLFSIRKEKSKNTLDYK